MYSMISYYAHKDFSVPNYSFRFSLILSKSLCNFTISLDEIPLTAPSLTPCAHSVIFFHTPEQEKEAKSLLEKLEKSGRFKSPIVTRLKPAQPFYKAEDYHQGYYMSDVKVLTRFGLVSRAKAYKGYREGCGRDARVRELWGDQAFMGMHKAGS